MRREELYLLDIINACDSVSYFLAGLEKDVFVGNDLLQSAVLHKLTIIGEASNKVSNELQLRHPQVEWKAIIGFRNIAVHAYFSIRWEDVYDTATKRLVALSEQINHILQADFPDFELRIKN
jgi:uncharacterized protein with HEPN domain